MSQYSVLQLAAERQSREARQQRHVSSPDGEDWSVFEFLREGGKPVLIFESLGRWRRVASYPANWADLSQDALLELCRRP